MSRSLSDRRRMLVEVASRLDVALATLSRITTLTFISRPATLFDPVPELDRNHPDSAQLLKMEEAFLDDKTLLSGLPGVGDPDLDGRAQHLLQRADFALRRLNDIRIEQWGNLRMGIAIDEFTGAQHRDTGMSPGSPRGSVI